MVSPRDNPGLLGVGPERQPKAMQKAIGIDFSAPGRLRSVIPMMVIRHMSRLCTLPEASRLGPSGAS